MEINLTEELVLGGAVATVGMLPPLWAVAIQGGGVGGRDGAAEKAVFGGGTPLTEGMGTTFPGALREGSCPTLWVMGKLFAEGIPPSGICPNTVLVQHTKAANTKLVCILKMLYLLSCKARRNKNQFSFHEKKSTRGKTVTENQRGRLVKDSYFLVYPWRFVKYDRTKISLGGMHFNPVPGIVSFSSDALYYASAMEKAKTQLNGFAW